MSFNVGYKPMKIKPKINALEGTKNYAQWNLTKSLSNCLSLFYYNAIFREIQSFRVFVVCHQHFPPRKSRSLDVGYKPMKVKPKINAFEGTKNYSQWSRRMTSLLTPFNVVIDGAIPSVVASDHLLDVYALMQQDGAPFLNLTVKERILDAVISDYSHLRKCDGGNKAVSPPG